MSGLQELQKTLIVQIWCYLEAGTCIVERIDQTGKYNDGKSECQYLSVLDSSRFPDTNNQKSDTRY